jgi:hypothetical protein
MTRAQIVCANCGARFQLPENFNKDRAKCSKCGAVIDVAAQRAAPVEAGPAAAVRPAAAATHQPRSPGRPQAARAPAAGHRQERPGESRTASPRERRHAPPVVEEKKGKGLVIGLSIGAVAVLGGVLAFALGGGDEPKPGEGSGQTPVANAPASNDSGKPASGAPVVAPDPKESSLRDQQKPVEAVSRDAGTLAAATAPPEPKPAAQDPKPATQAPPKPSETPATKPTDARPAAAKAPGKRLITSPDQVYNPKKELAALEYPADTTDAERKEMAELMATMRSDSGGPGARAGRKLQAHGHKALFAITNTLRELDYLKVSDNAFAYTLNQKLQDMLIVVNAGFKAVNIEEGKETMDLQTADFNAQTVLVWHSNLYRWDTKEKYEAWVKEKKARHEGELEGEGPKK